jgi:hypothetical protein
VDIGVHIHLLAVGKRDILTGAAPHEFDAPVAAGDGHRLAGDGRLARFDRHGAGVAEGVHEIGNRAAEILDLKPRRRHNVVAAGG